MKPWHTRLSGHVQTWTAALPEYRRWWPFFAYHFTNVANAVNIVTSGAILSRDEATRRQLMVTDNASAAVIQSTNPDHFKYARLYFRPRTPTQYHNEGIRPRAQRTGLNAHCAMPVFFFLDFVSVMSADETLFSDGNIASSRATIRNDEQFFTTIPFVDVYSDGGMGTRAGDLTFRRHAEILAPNALPLAPHLKFVCCRSVAERQTFLHLLGPQLRPSWEAQVRVDTGPIFERRATFVETASAVGEILRFTFNPGSRYRGPFKLDFAFVAADGRRWSLQVAQWDQEDSYGLRMAGIAGVTGVAELRLDDDLAFQGQISFASLPF